MRELALFAGAGGGLLASKLLGWRTVCAVEWDDYARNVLVARQNDGTFETFPIWDDVQTFDGTEWRGRVDVISGGFPCQDISSAGKGAGIDGEKSGMWKHFARIISEVRPQCVFVENSPMLTSRGLGRVLGDLAALGFDAEWGVLSAADVGANHRRERIWILADSDRQSCGASRPSCLETSPTIEANAAGKQPSFVAHSDCDRCYEMVKPNVVGTPTKRPTSQIEYSSISAGRAWWKVEPILGRVVDGVAHRTNRLKCIGNGQVPQCAATAFRLLSERF